MAADLLNDPRFAAQPNRGMNWNELMSEVEIWTKLRPARDCEDILMAAGIPCSRYKTVSQAIDDPQIAARGLMQTVSDAVGPFQVPNPPFKFDDGTVRVSPSVSAVGAFTREVLIGLGDLSEADIDALAAANHVLAT